MTENRKKAISDIFEKFENNALLVTKKMENNVFLIEIMHIMQMKPKKIAKYPTSTFFG